MGTRCLRGSIRMKFLAWMRARSCNVSEAPDETARWGQETRPTLTLRMLSMSSSDGVPITSVISCSW